MKKVILILFILSNTVTFSQNTNEVSIVKEITDKAGVFLLEKGEINNVKNLEQKISIIEILEKKVLGYNKIGIYRLYSHKTPSFVYIILKNKNDFLILDLKEFSKALNKINLFFETSGFENDLIVSYLDKIIQVYKKNDYEAEIRW